MKIKIHIALITPNNFAHKAGDGKKTRKHNIKYIHPSLQANCGATQCTYLLEIYKAKERNNDKDYSHTNSLHTFVLPKEQQGVV